MRENSYAESHDNSRRQYGADVYTETEREELDRHDDVSRRQKEFKRELKRQQREAYEEKIEAQEKAERSWPKPHLL